MCFVNEPYPIFKDSAVGETGQQNVNNEHGGLKHEESHSRDDVPSPHWL